MRISACVLAAGFIFASFYCMITSKKNKETVKFIKLLDSPEQISIYKQIVAERTVLFIQGQILGILVALFYIYCFRNDSQFNYCIFALATYLITVAYYLIMPKKKYIIDHLKTQEQKVAWRNSNASMSRTYIMGFILGMVGYILLGRIFSRIFNRLN